MTRLLPSGLDPADHRHLLPGHVYRAAVSYEDFDRHLHPAGETWTFLAATYLPHDAGLTLYMRGSGGLERVRLQDAPDTQGAVVADLEAVLVRVEALPEDHVLGCACAPPAWRLVGELAGLEVLVCDTCAIMVGLESPEAGTRRMLALDAARRAELERAAGLDPAGPLDALIDAALACTAPPANLLVATRLAQRASLARELAQRLGSEHLAQRVPVLDMVARMRPVPAALAPAVIRAFTHPLDEAAVSDERLRALLALYPVAAEAPEARPTLEWLLERVQGLEGELPSLIQRVAERCLARLDAAGS